MNPRQLLVESFRAAVAAADPLQVLVPHLPGPPRGKTVVIGAGKAAASMARAVEEHWPANKPLEGLVITRYQHGLLTNRIKVVEAGHPVPDQAGQHAAREVLRLATSLGPNDLLLALISGGGSALLSLPADGVSMDDLRAATAALLRCGAPIQDVNAVRKHLSAILGGRLAAACRSRVLALIVSDVTGDDPTHIASGPCAPDSSRYADAIDVIDRYRVAVPAPVRAHLERGARGEISETPKPGDNVFARVENRVIAAAQASLQAACGFFQHHRVPAVILGDSVTGEAAEVAKVYAALVRQVVRHHEPFAPPLALVSGGECTVTVRGNGRGGRAVEFLLSLAIDLAGEPNVHALACDTDGIDGTEDNAGALFAPNSLARAAAFGLNAEKMLANNDAYTFFAALSDLVITGPTRTNVNDYRAILII
ncbi:MAG: glycerate kinase [Betaproteobacteria bacterium]|nr:glycerate kinase [Betaproteobacteria bacterium]